ncbi:vWA domain-containing protein [Flavobacterium sp. AJR]|uniref:vWA domain-containing protein n=1 Tax=Flavobacterium sp. AJR TaxID=1979369 RepID=UPI000A3D7770|nr:hypothetical protein [Flavobacterium sp. AJR]OUL60367.1 hypothetical protein B8T70_20790 [Flavobacterium sp. AJR]
MSKSFKIQKYWVVTIGVLLFSLSAFAQDYSNQIIGFEATNGIASLGEHEDVLAHVNRQSKIDLLDRQQISQYPIFNKSNNFVLSDSKSEQTKNIATNSALSLTTVVEIPALEKAALIAFYNSTNGANWGIKTPWDITSDVSTWAGVGITDGHVTSLTMENYKLTGVIPREIGNLTYLKKIYFLSNNLTGPIPVEITQLANLEELVLAFNQLSGTIPSQIGNLLKLKQLALNGNQLTGGIPVEIGKLTELLNVYLHTNNLTGSIPAEVINLTKIGWFTCKNNNLSGKIPLFAPSLWKLEIQENDFRFADIAPYYAAHKNIRAFVYAPQHNTDTRDFINVEKGKPATLAMFTDTRSDSQDTYQWYKGFSSNGTLISGATSREYTIPNFQAANEGYYYCIAKNLAITNSANNDQNLILERNFINLKLAVDCSNDYNRAGEIQLPNAIYGDQRGIFINRLNTVNFLKRYTNSGSSLTYDWKLYDANGILLQSATTTSFPINLTELGNYKITLTVSDLGCSSNYEQIITARDPNVCIISPEERGYNADIEIPNYGDIEVNTDVILNLSQPSFSTEPFAFNWSLFNPAGLLISSGTTPTFSINLPTLGEYRVELKITDPNGCSTNYVKTVTSLDACGLTENERQFRIWTSVDEYNTEAAALVKINEPFEVGPDVRGGPENEKKYTYSWTLYNPNGELVTSESIFILPLTLTIPGYYRVNLTITDILSGCTSIQTRVIGCLINNSCTNENPKSNIVKDLLANLIAKLITRSLLGETDQQINATQTAADLEALRPYITSMIGTKIYNYATLINEYNQITSLSFSFSPDREYDVRLSFKFGFNYYIDNERPIEEIYSEIASFLPINISQYMTPNEYLITCDVGAPPSRMSKSATILNPSDCPGKSEIRFVNFCPPDCSPTIGEIKSTLEDFCIAQPSAFTFETTATNLSYKWTATTTADVVINTVLNNTTGMYSYTFTEPGSYIIKAEVTDALGCTAFFSKAITVKTTCLVETICINEPVNLSFETTSTNLTYEWSAKNSDNVIVNSITNTTGLYSFTPTISGNYTIYLKVYEKSECTFEFSKVIKVDACEPFVSCTKKNENTKIIKSVFIALVNKLASLPAETITNGFTNNELKALAFYVKDENPGIYNFVHDTQQGFIAFSFADHPDYDVKIAMSGNVVADFNLDDYESNIIVTELRKDSNDRFESFVNHIDFCSELYCTSHIAIVVDESGSIDPKEEATKIKKQLKKFIKQQADDNDDLRSDVYVSLIGMSDGDTTVREDHVLGLRVTNKDASVLKKFNDWIDKYGSRSGVGISASSDYWKSGLDVALNLTMKPNVVIMITDGCETNNVGLLKETMSKFRNSKDPFDSSTDKPHLYVVGIEDGFYVDGGLTSGKLARNEDPNYVPTVAVESGESRVVPNLTTSLKYLLSYSEKEFPVAHIDDFAEADYYGHANFDYLGTMETYLSDNLKLGKFSCGEPAAKNYCSDCLSFQPVPGKEYMLSAWVKEESFVQVKTYENAVINVIFYNDVKAEDFYRISTEKLSASGDIIDGWQRIAAKFLIPKGTKTIGIELENKSGGIPAYYDDIRIYPLEGSVKTFVYDSETFKLMSELDENNYSTFYEYDNEGGLVRIKKETAKGVKTIQETRSGNIINN